MVFPTTRWTLIRAAASASTENTRVALDELCGRYAGPVLAFLRRRSASREAAEDLLQEFLTHLLDGDLLSRADPERGSFRAFLLNAVRNFQSDARTREAALKRGGRVRHVTLDSHQYPGPLSHLSPEIEFEVQWARAVLQSALDRLQAEYVSQQRGPLFDMLRDQLDGRSPTRGRDLAAQLEMSEPAVRVAIHRMRQRLGLLIREEIAETVVTASEVDEELLRLRRALEQKR